MWYAAPKTVTVGTYLSPCCRSSLTMRAPSLPFAPATNTVCKSVLPDGPRRMVPSCLPIVPPKLSAARAVPALGRALSRLVPLRWSG